MKKPFEVGDKVRLINNHCRVNEFTVGETATIISTTDDRVKVVFDDPNSRYHGTYLFPSRFELIEDTRIIDEDLKRARTFLNKEVKSRSADDKFIVTGVKVFLKEDGVHFTSSLTVISEVKKYGFCVALIGNVYNIPVSDVVELPSSKTVKLNDTYDAVVTKTDITVGCQTFPIDKLRELQEAFESL